MLWGLIGNSVSRNAFLQCKTFQLCCFLAPKLSSPMADFCLSHSSHLSKPCVEEKIRICMAVTQIKVGNIWGFLAKEMSLDNTKFVAMSNWLSTFAKAQVVHLQIVQEMCMQKHSCWNRLLIPLSLLQPFIHWVFILGMGGLSLCTIKLFSTTWHFPAL